MNFRLIAPAQKLLLPPLGDPARPPGGDLDRGSLGGRSDVRHAEQLRCLQRYRRGLPRLRDRAGRPLERRRHVHLRGPLPAVREPGRGGFPGRRVRPLREPVRLDEPDVHRHHRDRPDPDHTHGRPRVLDGRIRRLSHRRRRMRALRRRPAGKSHRHRVPLAGRRSRQPRLAATGRHQGEHPGAGLERRATGRRRSGGPRGHPGRAAGGRGPVRRRHVGQGVRDRVARTGRAPSPGHGRPRSAAGAERDGGGVGDPAGRSAGGEGGERARQRRTGRRRRRVGHPALRVLQVYRRLRPGEPRGDVRRRRQLRRTARRRARRLHRRADGGGQSEPARRPDRDADRDADRGTDCEARRLHRRPPSAPATATATPRWPSTSSSPW